MVDVRQVPPADVERGYALLQSRVGDHDRAAVEQWYDDHPALFVGAYDRDAMVGFALARAREDAHVELVGIAVEASHARRGIGSALLTAVEEAARDRGFERLTLGSAGGYVDDFYAANGYRPESILVRLAPEAAPEDPESLGFEVLRERTADDGTRKFYVAPNGEGVDADRVEAVGDAYGDPEAIYVMEKRL